MRLQVLGSIELIVDGQQQALGGPTARLLLAVLVAQRRCVVGSDFLLDALWGEAPPRTARSTLQTHVSKLRRALGARGASIANRPPGYVLEVERRLVDADCFEDELDEARALVQSDPWTAATRLDANLARWRGAAFAEFADAPWAQAEAIRLEELRLVAREERAEALLAAGEHASLVGELEGLVHDHPLRERPWRQLMLALHRSGRQAEALRVAHRVHALTREEFGLEPSEELRSLEAAIARDDPSLRLHAAAPVLLPAVATELVGRERDLDRLLAAPPSRVLTLTGPGGVGKSRLATALVPRLASARSDSFRVVELATVRDGAAVIAAVAAALDVEQRPERSLEESVVEVLAPLELLLLLDNCEHVIDAVGRIVGALVRWCPQVRILATSREPIGLSGEVVWPVAPLALPASVDADLDEIVRSPAVELFRSRARDAAPEFRVDELNAADVAGLCLRLDGLPLALELAAARMASMSPRQLAARIDRLELLERRNAVDPRHRTLVGVVQWSYELLPPEAQLLFARLSVFVGPFDLEAAEQACSDAQLPRRAVAGLITTLVDRSLVTAEHVDGCVRYRLLQTVRQYAADQLDRLATAPDVRRAHVDAFVAKAERGALAVDGPEEAQWSTQLDRDLGDVRAAVLSATSMGDVDRALRLVAASREPAFRRIRYEIVAWAEAAAGLDGARDHPLLPTVLAVVGYGSWVRGELERAIELAGQALEAHRRLAVPSCGLAERVLANALCYGHDVSAALGWIDAMVVTARAAAGDGRLAHALYMQSVARSSIGDTVAGADVAREAETVARRTASPTALAQAAYAAGFARASTSTGESLALLERATTLASSAGNRWLRAFAATEAMWLRARRGETPAALRGYRAVVETWYRHGDWANQWLSLRQVAGVLASAGRDETAAVLFAAVDAAGATSALPLAQSDADELQGLSESLEQRLGADAVLDARWRASSMRDDAVVALALAEIDTLLT